MTTRIIHAAFRGLLSLGLFLTVRLAGGAATFVVTTNADSGPGSLRQAVADANVGGGTILFSNVTGTITLTSGQLVFTNHLTVLGPGLAVSGGLVGRVFKINSGSTSSISGLTIQQGWTGSDGTPGGAGILVVGHLALSNCVVTGNTWITPFGGGFGGGGGLCNQGFLTLENCFVFYNVARPLSGRVSGWGGGIFNLGVMYVSASRISGNSTLAPGNLATTQPEPPPHGGGIYNSGTLFLARSTISGNSTGAGNDADAGGGNGGSGGGLYNNSSVTIVDCTINNNQSGRGGYGGGGCCSGQAPPGGNGGNGGGIYSAGTIYLTNTTIYENTTGGGGGGGNNFSTPPRMTGNGGNGGDGAGLYFTGTGVLVSCTLTKGITGAAGPTGQGSVPGNVGAPGRGGGIWNQSGTLQLRNTIIASNAAFGDGTDVGGSFASQGHNLIAVTNGSTGFVATNDLVGSPTAPLDALLAPLANNGGPTLTHALLPGSPALDAGDDSLTGTDQRGFPRRSGARVDIGAFEFTTPAWAGVRRQSNGAVTLTALSDTPFNVVAHTNVVAPSNQWLNLGPATLVSNSLYQFTEPGPTNRPHRFYRLRWP